MVHSIVLIGAWFGPWPIWVDFFLISCRANKDVDWLIFSDQPPPDSTPGNVKIVSMSFAEYKSIINTKLSIVVHDNARVYKFCDFKPALGHLHFDYIKHYDFFGFTDFDVVYGVIRSIYDKDVLDRYDALSTHTMHISGHLFLMRNTKEMRTAFMSIPKWKTIYQDSLHVGFDEQDFYGYFKHGRSKYAHIRSLGRRKPYLFREAYSTPMPTKDMRWYWKDGMLSNEFYPQRSFLYLHFMVWHSSKWYPFVPNVSPGTHAPWQDRADVVQIDWRTAQEEGFMISPAGIQAIEVRPYP